MENSGTREKEDRDDRKEAMEKGQNKNNKTLNRADT